MLLWIIAGMDPTCREAVNVTYIDAELYNPPTKIALTLSVENVGTQ